MFRPIDFYSEGCTSDRLEEFLKNIPLGVLNAELEAGASAVRFATALFSWGDVAREAMFEDGE